MKRYRNWAIGLIWACFLARGAYHSAMFPLWEGWDEWSHFAYLQHFANTGKLPVPGVARPSREIEASMLLVPLPWTVRHHAFGVYSHDLYWKLGKEERDSLQQRLLALPAKWQREPAREADPIYQAQQPPLYYWLLYPPLLAVELLPIPSRIFWLRLAGIFLASLAIPLGYAASRRVLGSDRMAGGAIALVADC